MRIWFVLPLLAGCAAKTTPQPAASNEPTSVAATAGPAAEAKPPEAPPPTVIHKPRDLPIQVDLPDLEGKEGGALVQFQFGGWTGTAKVHTTTEVQRWAANAGLSKQFIDNDAVWSVSQEQMLMVRSKPASEATVRFEGEGADKPEVQALGKMIAAMKDVEVTWAVDPTTGQYMGMENPEAVATATRERVDGVLAELVAAKPEMGMLEQVLAPIVGPMLQPAAIEETYMTQWEEFGPGFHGADLVAGEVLNRELDLVVPSYPDPVPHRIQVLATANQPCVEGGEPRCIRVESLTKVDAEAFTARIQAGVGQVGGQVGAFDQMMYRSVWIEADALRPYRYSEVMTSYVELTMSGRTVPRLQRRDTEMTFDWSE